jgi:DNA-binding transcriptional regulator GbsR (MarR family)
MSSVNPAAGNAAAAPLYDFVENFALWFDRVPRMGGRILGWLLVCDPAEQTMQDLADHLQASMGSISSMTRLLEQHGLIELARTPGDRRLRYRARPIAFANAWDDQIVRTERLQALLDQALQALDPDDVERRDRLTTSRRFTAFYLQQLPELIAKWDAFLAEEDVAP